MVTDEIAKLTSYQQSLAAFKRQDYHAAISLLESLTSTYSDVAPLWNMLGASYQGIAQYEKAIDAYSRALDCQKYPAEIWYNMGLAYKAIGKLSQAVSAIERYLESDPNNKAVALNNLGACYTDLQDNQSACHVFMQAVKEDPEYKYAYFNLANGLLANKQYREAIACFKKAVDLDPEYLLAHAALLHQFQHSCDWHNFALYLAEFELKLAAIPSDKKTISETPLAHISRCMDEAKNLEVAKIWANYIKQSVSYIDLAFPPRRKDPQTPINIGYISSDIRHHPVGHLISGLIKHHDRSQFTVTVYSQGKDDQSPFRKEIEQSCDKFRDVSAISTAETAALIYEDAIDILIDLNGYTKGQQLGVCALRPAPIQITYLGFIGSSGADFFDYVITDKIVTPLESVPFYTESFLTMPDCYLVNSYPDAFTQNTLTRQEVGLPEDALILACMNQGFKLEPTLFDTWLDILNELPSAILWLNRSNSLMSECLTDYIINKQVDPKRIIYAENTDYQTHLQRIGLADIALDTLYYNGGATSSDMLWAGVPVVTLKGRHFASRMTSSMLHCLDMDELITHDIDQYKEVIMQLATNPDRLAQIKEKLQENGKKSPLFDTERFTRNLERALGSGLEILPFRG